MRHRQFVVLVVALVSITASIPAQTPQPFPKPGQTPSRPPAPQVPTTTPPSRSSQEKPSDTPNQETLGVPIYPSAQFITSYDAGRGQRFYLFGVAAPFSEMVLYYRAALKQKGDELFAAPPTHQFEIGRYREETMAFTPSVTIKDYTWGGSAGYPNPRRGVQPERFPTVIQIVPVPPGTTP